MNFDLVIKGGEVVDPGSGLLGKMDVGIRGGVHERLLHFLLRGEVCIE